MGFTIRPLHAFSRFAQVERSAAAAWVLVGVLGCAGVATAAPVTLNIPAQDLAGALRAFSDQSGIQVLYEPSLLEGKRAGAISGQMDSSAAVGRLLQGSGLRYRMEGGALLLLPPSDGSAVELGATNINSANSDASTEHTKSYTSDTVSIGKLLGSVKETPQSVSVITQQRMQDQHITTVNDVLGKTTGVTVFQGSSQSSRYLARGFDITNYRVDGGASVRSVSFASKDQDMAIYDHVEVLRGADGLYAGNGEPGGSVNLVRKRPTAINQVNIVQSVGSWDNYRTELDVSGPLGFDGRLRGRSVVVYQDRNSYLDNFGADRNLFHGVLEADLTETTVLSVGYTHNRIRSSYQSYGLPRYNNGDDLDLPRSTYYSGKDDQVKRSGDSVYARVEQRLGDDWELTVDAISSENKINLEYYSFDGTVDPATRMGPAGGWFADNALHRDDAVDVSVKGSFDLLGGHHDAVLGYSWSRNRIHTDGLTWLKGGRQPIGDIFAFDPGNYPTSKNASYLTAKGSTYSKQSGIYGSVRFQLFEPLHLILGGRYNDYEFSEQYSAKNPSGAETFSFQTVYADKNVFTPFAALTYRLDEDWTAYSSVAEIYLSQASNLKGPPPGSSSLDPIQGRAYEIGLKGLLFDGRLSVNTALYHIRREGEAVRDLSYPRSTSAVGASCCYLGEGEVTSKGVELEVSGQITERLEGVFGYTYNHKVATAGSTGLRALNITPKHLAKAFLTYQMHGALENVRVGAGVNAQSVNSVEEGDIHYSQAGYAIYSAFAEYRLNDHWSLAFNGDNLMNKKYYSTLGNTGYGNFYGDPRSFSFTVRGSY